MNFHFIINNRGAFNITTKWYNSQLLTSQKKTKSNWSKTQCRKTFNFKSNIVYTLQGKGGILSNSLEQYKIEDFPEIINSIIVYSYLTPYEVFITKIHDIRMLF